MWAKRYIGLLCATVGVFMCIYYTFTLEKIDNELRIDSKLLDYDLVSIEDCSVRGGISKSLYN